jgi:FkbM family methyltransferase
LLAAVEELLRQGLTHFGAGQYADAERLYQAALETDPDNPDALHLLGLVAGKTGEPNKAIQLIQRAISGNPTTAFFHLNLGNAYRTTGNFIEATDCYRQAMSLDPNFAEAHGNMGDILVETGRLTEAMTCYREAVEIKPAFANAHNNMGNLFARQGDLKSASDCYRLATQHDPLHADAYSNLGYTLTDLREFEAAEASCRRSVEVDPGHAAAWCNLSRVLFLRNEFTAAEEAAIESLRLAPNMPEASLVLGHVYASSDRRGAAIESYRTALELLPDSTEAYMALGNFLATEGVLETEHEALPKLRIAVADDVKLWVPKLLGILTPYVLLEQEDWFEDEIKFVRCLLQPGDQAVDIGANYGCYTFAMSKAVGASGKVWAFEPASLTAFFLNLSCRENKATNLHIFQAAVSDQAGTAAFNLSMAPELSGLGEQEDGFLKEEVDVLTLDHCAETTKWKSVAFIKIDAEGHESQVLAGAKRVLEAHSPLIMYEIAHRGNISGGLVSQFADLGYQTYRLIPGIGVLAPVDDEVLSDVSVLNLFCCKPDRAAKLAARGLLIEGIASTPDLPADAWIRYLESKAYYPAQRELIADFSVRSDIESASYREAVGYYGLSTSKDLTLDERYACLLKSLSMLKPIASSLARGALLARVSGDLGQRYASAEALLPIVDALPSLADHDLTAPLVPAAERFDSIDPDGRLWAWATAAVTEHFLWHADLSSLQSPPSRLDQHDALEQTCFGNCEGTRRRLLFRGRFDLPPDTEANDPIYQATLNNLNPDFWDTNFPPVS